MAAFATKTRPTRMSLFPPCSRPCWRQAFPARIQPPPPKDISRRVNVHPNLLFGLAKDPGMSNIATNRNIAIPNSRPDHCTLIFVAMLKDAESSAKPKKYPQNNRHGIYEGTMGTTNSTSERCKAPKTARGAAKHILLKATILSKPLARAISAFAAHSATRNSRMPAVHIETTVREIRRNAVRIVVCMWMPGVRSRAQIRAVLRLNTTGGGDRLQVGKQPIQLFSDTSSRLEVRICPARNDTDEPVAQDVLLRPSCDFQPFRY